METIRQGGSRGTVVGILLILSVIPLAIVVTTPVSAQTDKTLEDLKKEIQLQKEESKLAVAKAKSQRKLDRLKRKAEGVGVNVLIDHKNGVQVQKTIRLREGEAVLFRVINTSRECYEFNFQEVPKPKTQGIVQLESDHEDNVEFEVIHDATTASYQISAKRKSGRNEKECPYERTWQIKVKDVGWDLGFAGAYVVHKLTNPAYALSAGDNGMNEIVLEDKEDDWDRSAVAMVHLSHSGAFHLGKGVRWTPMSFGVDVATDNDAKYYFGTGLKFGNKAYLTAGYTFGAREELGPGLEVGDMITGPNLPLQSRNDTAFFMGVSFSFINANISNRLSQPFAVKSPDPKKEPVDAPKKIKFSYKESDLNQYLSGTQEKYTVTKITKKTQTNGNGDDLTSIEFEYKRGDNAALTAADDKNIVELFTKLFPETKFVPKH